MYQCWEPSACSSRQWNNISELVLLVGSTGPRCPIFLRVRNGYDSGKERPSLQSHPLVWKACYNCLCCWGLCSELPPGSIYLCSQSTERNLTFTKAAVNMLNPFSRRNLFVYIRCFAEQHNGSCSHRLWLILLTSESERVSMHREQGWSITWPELPLWSPSHWAETQLSTGYSSWSLIPEPTEQVSI